MGITHAKVSGKADPADTSLVMPSDWNAEHVDSFSPDDLSGLALWLDASDATTINAGSPSDTDPVSAWADKSASGYDAAQATADNRPVYRTAIQNGLSIIRFDPSSFSQFLSLSGAGLNLFRNIDGCTVAVVAKANANDLFFASVAGNGTYPRLAVLTGAGTSGLYADPTDSQITASTESLLNYQSAFITLIAYVDAARTGIGEVETVPYARVDNAGYLTSAASFVDTASNSITIGASEGNSVTGDLGELIVWQRVLKSSERRELHEYLADKWGTL